VKTSPRAGGGEAACHKTLKLEFQLRTKDVNKCFCYFICNGNNNSNNNNNNNTKEREGAGTLTMNLSQTA